VQNIFILVLSFHLIFLRVQLVAGFSVGAIRCGEFKNPSGNTCGYRRHFWDKPHTVRLNFKHTNHDGERKTKAMQTIASHEMLSSTTMITALVVTPLIILIPQPVLAMDNLLGGFSIILNHVDPRYFLSGGLCACFSHGITTPVDVVKTRIQSDPQKYDGLDIVGASKVVVNEDGYGALLKGFGPTAMGYGLEGAAKFGLYESLKPTIAGLLHLKSPNVAYIIASVVAGGVASVILCPLERTRIRLVTDPNFSEYNTVTGIQRLIEESGVVSLFYGLPAMLSKQCPYTLGKQVTYDAICTALYSIVDNVNDASTKVEVSFLAACCAAIVACVLSQPGDVILTESYKQKNGSSPSSSFSTVVSTFYNERPGVSGFYTGIVARLIQVGGIITSQLLLYDYIKQSLGLPATGSS
jgi:solute carrier family 25 phosphate transporter 3